jgi:hypothetical protein
MKLQRITYLSAAFAAAVLLVGCSAGKARAQSTSQISAKTTNDGYRLVEQQGFTLKWKIDGGKIDCSVSYPTTGWVGVGFSPSTKMKDANIIIGFVKDGQATVTDQFGTSATFHQRDVDLGGKNDLSAASGTEADGKTTIRFKMPLASGDKEDRPLEEGAVTTVILAHGPNGADDLSTYHGQGGRLTLKVKL